MIALRTPYGTFDLKPDFRLSIVEKNNALDWENDFSLERSYPADLPWTENNARIWQNVDIKESTDNYLSLPCELTLDGNSEFLGKAYLLQTVEGVSYTITLTFDREILNPQTLISEINFESLSTFDTDEDQLNYLWNDSISTIVNGDCSSCPYALPSGWHRHYAFDIYNQWQTSTQQYYDSRQIIPMFYLGYVFKKISEIWGLKIDGCFESDTELKKLLIFNVFAADYNPIILTAGNEIRTQLPLEMKYHLPPVTISALFKMFRIRFGGGVHFDLENVKLYLYTLRDCINSTNDVDVTDYVKENVLQEIKPNRIQPSFIQEFDAQDELVEYIKPDLDKNYRGSVATDGALFALTGMNNGDIYLVEDTDYYWIYNGTGGWSKYQYRYFIKRGESDEEIIDKSSSVITTLKLDTLNGVNYKIHESDYGKENFENNNINFGLRLILYHGLRDTYGVSPTQYPFASIDNIDSNGAQIGDLQLRDDGEFGLYEKYKSYRVLALTQAKKPRIVLKNCAHILKDLKPYTPVRVQSQRYLWSEKTRVYDIHGLAEVELRTEKL